MNFDFSFEQTLLAESVGKMLDGFAPVTDKPPFPYAAADVVKRASELGLFETEDGSLLLGHVDAVAVAHQIGRRLPAAPLTEMLAAGLGLAGIDARIEPALAKGETIGIAVAGRLRMGDGFAAGRLLVPFAAETALAVAPCETESGTRWLAVETRTAESHPAETFDIVTDARWLTFENMPVDPTNHPESSRFEDALNLLILAEMTGSAAACLEQTVDYVKDRNQFGKPVGSNQAVKHMAADAATSLEAMKASVEYAAWALDQSAGKNPEASEDARLSLMTARSFVGERAKKIAEQCVQMHGGIAFTWDYGLHRFLKRINYRRSTIVKPRDGRADLARALLETALRA
jgi:alkylation response protein AidB-like acyl-CoA dehydrogenase